MSQEEVTSLNRKRGFVKGRQTLFKNYLLDLKNRISTEGIEKIERKEIVGLESRLERNVELMKEFNELQDALENMSDDVDEILNEQSEFENVYHDLNSEAKIILETYHASTMIQDFLIFI
ncbi:hypothetical protein JTB14_007010 [Gonioctena quinquepunctata]|nr:hypothetical protein JTB14_007010 [Gonioctena quinquepunctata]